MYKQIDNTIIGGHEETELTEKLTDQRTELRNYTDNIEQVGRVRIHNFYQDKNGKNTAESFTITKENKGEDK